MKIKHLLTLLALLATAPLASRGAAVDYFLKIEGVDGESTDRGHRNEIDATGFSWGVSNPTPVGGGGAGAGKVSVHDISITKSVDKSSSKLMVACATGKHFKSVVLTMRKSGRDGRGVEFLVITLEDVLVSSYQVSGDGGGTSEKLELSFAGLTMKTADGTTGELSIEDNTAR